MKNILKVQGLRKHKMETAKIINITTLPERVQLFARHLREYEVAAGPGEIILFLQAVAETGPGDEENFKAMMRMIFCSKKEELEIFNMLYPLYFSKSALTNTIDRKRIHLSSNLAEKQSDHQEEKNQSVKNKSKKEAKQTLEAIRLATAVHNTEKQQNSSEREARTAALPINQSAAISAESDKKVETKVWKASRFTGNKFHNIQVSFEKDSLTAFISAARIFDKNIKIKQGRRWKSQHKGKRIDFRKLMRKIMQTGGRAALLPKKARPVRKTKYLLLCDSSRSMADFSVNFLQFAYGLTLTSGKAEIFLFSNTLKRITQQFKNIQDKGDPAFIFSSEEWGSGTRIGDSFIKLTENYEMMLTKDTIVLIGSDGLDTGKTESLRKSMEIFQRKTAGVVWFNPLLAVPGYEPEANGMKAALPYIDSFLSAEDASSYQKAAFKIRNREWGK